MRNTKSLLVDLGGADGDVVVTVLDIGKAAAVLEGGVLLEADKRRRLAKGTKSLAVRLIIGLGAVGVHPELGGARVKVDGDGRGRRADLKVNGVEETGLAVVEASLELAAHVLLERILVAGQRESHDTRTFIKVVGVEGVSGQRQGGRDREESRTHG